MSSGAPTSSSGGRLPLQTAQAMHSTTNSPRARWVCDQSVAQVYLSKGTAAGLGSRGEGANPLATYYEGGVALSPPPPPRHLLREGLHAATPSAALTSIKAQPSSPPRPHEAVPSARSVHNSVAEAVHNMRNELSMDDSMEDLEILSVIGRGSSGTVHFGALLLKMRLALPRSKLWCSCSLSSNVFHICACTVCGCEVSMHDHATLTWKYLQIPGPSNVSCLLNFVVEVEVKDVTICSMYRARQTQLLDPFCMVPVVVEVINLCFSYVEHLTTSVRCRAHNNHTMFS
jgi:hypothetical protein